MNNVVRLINYAQRRMDQMFPGYFAAAKHDHYKDFGYPLTLDFAQLYGMYSRNGVATAGVNKTILKTWQDNPTLLEQERDGSQTGPAKETALEAEIRQRFDDLRLWVRLAEADRMSLVGAYAGVILRFADSKKLSEPANRVPGGLDGLVEVIPAWEGQLTVNEWDTDETSPGYGQPKMYQFNEAAVDKAKKQPRQFTIHPSRVVIWSKDGTVNGRSILEPGYNDLMTMEKVSGAGGEGFWKNAKSAPVLMADSEARLDLVAKAMGIQLDELADKMNEQVEDFQKGFDKMLLLQGMEAKTLGIVLPSPEHFFAIALNSFAASINIPVKILVGMQTGERASSEDADEWAQTNMSRRANYVVPGVMALVKRLEDVGILAQKDWYLDWSDLTESSMSEKIDRAVKMTTANQNMKDGGEIIFTPEEIRATIGLEPLAESEKYRDPIDDPANTDPATDEEDAAALGGKPAGAKA
jgi:hypothetical protein